MQPVWQILQPYRFGLSLPRYTLANLVPGYGNSFFNILSTENRCISNRCLRSSQALNPLASSFLPMAMNELQIDDHNLGVDGNHTTKRTFKEEDDVPAAAPDSTESSTTCKVGRTMHESPGGFSSTLSDFAFRSPIFIPSQQIHTSSNPPQIEFEEMNAEKQRESPIENWPLEEMSEQMRKLRCWESVNKSEHPETFQDFTLMSYNVLAQNLLENNRYLYSHCNSENLSWSFRRDRLFAELINSKSDIICLQEVQEDHYQCEFQPFFELEGFSSIYKKRTGNKNDGCAIFYKKSSFELEKWVAVEFNKPGVWVLDRDNIGIVALFRPLNKSNTSSRICVATTHLLFNPKRGDVKLAQLQVLLAEIDNIAFKKTSSSGLPVYHPVILCGDLNSEPYCDIYNFLSTGTINYTGLPVATMSGQSKGICYRNRQLSSELLPSWLGITDQCQFLTKFVERNRTNDECDESVNSNVKSQDTSTETSDSSEPRMSAYGDSFSESENKSESELRISEYGDSSNPESGNKTENFMDPSNSNQCTCASDQFKNIFSSGQMLHHLKLLSVYQHELQRSPGEWEVTTHHTKASCTVDYIFYSVKKKVSYVKNCKVKHKDVTENNLKLLGYYGLLSGTEVNNFGGLPNAISPSDHLPLMARFALKT